MTARKASAQKTAAKKTAAGKDRGTRRDPVEGYLAQQSPDKRALLEKLHALVVKGVPDATVSIKWGVPFYQANGKNLCALAAFKEHVGINFFASPDVLVDPERKLEGSGKGSRMLKVRSADDINTASILRWLKAAAND